MISALLSTVAGKYAALGAASKTEAPALEQVEEASVPGNLPEQATFGRGVADDDSDPEAPGVSGPDILCPPVVRLRGPRSSGRLGAAQAELDPNRR